MSVKRKRIIIIGGGFAGAKCAKLLRKGLSRGDAEVVLFNRENHLVFSPLLADAVGSCINPLDAVVPLRQLLPGVSCRTEEVLNVDLNQNEVEYEGESGGSRRLGYDHLVIGCGNTANLSVVPGMADHAFPLKSLADAATLRGHVMEMMEKAEVCEDPRRRRWHLSFIIVGGGYSGVEAAGEINELARSSCRYFQSFREEDVSVTLIHGREQILPEIGADLREFAQKKMAKAGVKLMLNARVDLATPEGVGLAGGAFVPGGTIVCTIGSSTAPVIERLAVAKEKGRLATESDMRLRGLANVWAIGDCALITNAYDGKPSPPTGQFAERQGTQCARNIMRVLKREPTRPFRFKVLGQLCSIGGYSAVAEFLGWHFSGFLGWFLWRSVYLFKLPSWARRIQVAFDWGWLFLFPRDLSHLRSRPTDRVSHAHHKPGEFIFKQGEPPSNFYVLEAGEVELVRRGENHSESEVVMVLGPGSFFGEKALLDNQPRAVSARARTAAEVLVMGKNVFTQISKSLAPLRNALAQSVNQHNLVLDAWDQQPEAGKILHRTTLKEIMSPAPRPWLRLAATMDEVGRVFANEGSEVLYVTSEDQTLEGLVTISDWLRAYSTDRNRQTPVQEFMAKNPIALSPLDDGALAAAVIREHRLKSIPVVDRSDKRRVIGCVHALSLMACVYNELDSRGAAQSARSTR